jgi:hypothetical protein
MRQRWPSQPWRRGQPAAAELAFAESAAGYQQLRQRLEQIAQRHGPVQLVIRLDAAGQYADNLLHFLHQLAAPDADATRRAVSISCGDRRDRRSYARRTGRTGDRLRGQ